MIEFKEVVSSAFDSEDLTHFLAFIEDLDENLEGKRLPARFDWRIAVRTTGGVLVLHPGYWEAQYGSKALFLAETSQHQNAPTLRSRALVLLCALEMIARSVHLDESTEQRVAAQERRLLSYLPVREVVHMIPRATFVACDDRRHDAERVFGVAASADGEIIAVKRNGEWINLRGEVVTPPREAIMVEW